MKKFKRNYDLVEDLGYEKDMMDTISEYPNSYIIGDAIIEIADSNVYLYDRDLWEIAPRLRFYIEDAIYDYGNGEIDLIKIFQIGQFEYNSQVMYNNIDQIIFNIALDYLEMLLKNLNIDIKAFVKEIDMDLLVYDYIGSELKLSIDNNSRIKEINVLVNDTFFNFIEEQGINLINFVMELENGSIN